jgi:hypothetical protein
MDYKEKIRKLRQKGDFVSVEGKYHTIKTFVSREQKKTGKKYKASHIMDGLFIISLLSVKDD